MSVPSLLTHLWEFAAKHVHAQCVPHQHTSMLRLTLNHLLSDRVDVARLATPWVGRGLGWTPLGRRLDTAHAHAHARAHARV